MNIHLPLRSADDEPSLRLFNQALASNLALLQFAQDNEQIDLFSDYTAHVSLYLADFDVEDVNVTIQDANVRRVLDAVQRAVEQVSPCFVDWPADRKPVVQNSYAVYYIPVTPCLQYLSDLVVNATTVYIRRPPSAIPDWVNALRETERRIDEYGSPNVYKGFQPHITVGYDTVTPQHDRLKVLNSLIPLSQECSGNLSAVAIAMTGLGGMPLQDGQLLEVPLMFPNETVGTISQPGFSGTDKSRTFMTCHVIVAAIVGFILVVIFVAWRRSSQRHATASQYLVAAGDVEILKANNGEFTSYQNDMTLVDMI